LKAACLLYQFVRHPPKDLTMKAKVDNAVRAPAAPDMVGEVVSRVSRPTKSRSAFWLVTGLLALSAIPIAFGIFRLIELVGGASITPTNARFFAAPLPVVIHIVSASLYALLGPFQFAAGFRRRRPMWHRLAGRILLVCGLLIGLSGVWMTLFYPRKEGTGELLYGFRLLFGSAMVVAIVLGFTTIRRGHVAGHRAWMTRAYAIGLGAGTQVLTEMAGALLLSKPSEFTSDLLLGAGWVINLAVAEWIIRKPQGMTSFQVMQHLLQAYQRTGIALALGLFAALIGILVRPTPPTLSTKVTGDAELAARAQALLPGALDRVSIAVVDGAITTYAHFGADEHTQYEIGSLTKTFTGLLLADSIRRGEVTADTKVGELLPLYNTPIADVTLAELASHRAGLSAQGMNLSDQIPFVLRYLLHRNPFVHDVAGVLAIARKATLTERGAPIYSNLGVALLGHALAAAAEMEYGQLLQERLFTPLAMSASSLPLTPEDLASDAPTGYSATGIAEAPWTINGWSPAGGARSTPADLVRYVRALLDDSAPGTEALTPRWGFGDLQLGYTWMMRKYQAETVTYANGLTGGFTSKLVLDLAHHRAVIILSNTAASVDDAANQLLVGENAWIASP
jgi:CubicO group peptidase (beta-lactamase class C family)/uncharacterized membrane protein